MTTGTTTHGAGDAQRAAAAVRDRLGVRAPVIGIVLGSGLGTLADRLTDARRVPYADVPGFHAPKVEGHRGELIVGQLPSRNFSKSALEPLYSHQNTELILFLDRAFYAKTGAMLR